MSVGQFLIFFNWLAEGKTKEKLKAFFHNPVALLVSSIFVLHILGLIHTSDFQYAFKDLKIKIPLLLLPLVISTSKALSVAEFKLILKFFLVAVFVSSCVVAYKVLIENVLDPRLASPFISHIRLSLLMCLGIAYSMYYALRSQTNRILYLITALWLVFALFILEAFTGVFIFFALSTILLFLYSQRLTNVFHKAGILLFALGIPLLGVYLGFGVINNYFRKPEITLKAMPVYTEHGNPYTHLLDEYPIENGRYIGAFLSEDELRNAWNKRSGIPFDSLDKRKQGIKYTIMRYLTSKDLTKDSAGVSKLLEKDIRNIENGIANHHYTSKLSPYKRILIFCWEYDNYKRTGNPSGHSAMQRIEYWKTAKEIFKANYLFGVGTGDIRKEFLNTYEKSQSLLSPKFRLRAHNQYITMAIAFGIPGLLVFLLALFLPGFLQKSYSNYHFLSFFIIAALSMLNEDTLETQAGVTFFAFFFNLLLFAIPPDSKEKKCNLADKK